MPQTMTEREFLISLERSSETIRQAEKHGLEEGGKILEAEAKEEVGSYQREDMGSLPAWEELADATKDDRVRQGFTENDPGLRSGTMRDSYQAVSDAKKIILGSNDPHARFFELGTVKQPPRPVIATALFRKGQSITTQIAHRIASALAGERSER